MRINSMVKLMLQKEQMKNSKTNSSSSDDYVNPYEDPLRRLSSDSKRIIPVSDEIKKDVAEIIREGFMERGGMSGEGYKGVELINDYLETVAPEDRSAASWTLNCFRLEIAQKYSEEVRKHNPNWQYGEYIDPKILENFDPTEEYIDLKA